MTQEQITKKLINWFRTLSESEKSKRFSDYDVTEKCLISLPIYAKENILLYNGVK